MSFEKKVASAFQMTSKGLFLLCIIGSHLFFSSAANAIPAYARQTQQHCVACHAGGQFPELTPFGRLFKLTGYSIGSRTIPISAMGVVSLTKSLHPDDDAAFAKDASVIFQTGSVFLGGKITDQSGIFAQFTYNNYAGDSGTQGVWSADNFDARYTHQTDDWIFGLTLNNNPTVSDVWNTAPAWVNYVPTQFGVTGPDAAAVVSSLGAQVAGVTAYGLWNNLLYAEVGGYQTANRGWSFLSWGVPDADNTKLRGTNPYVRVALTRDWGDHHAMVGVFGLDVEAYPDNTIPSGPTVQYRDRGIDAQYQYLSDPQSFTGQLSYIRESIDNGDAAGIAANSSNTLNAFRIKGTYIYQAQYGVSLTYARTTGSSDALLYTSSTASPDTQFWSPEIFWMPTENIRVGLQYYVYQKFDGANQNYDGNGRNARDNNTAFLYLWGAY